MKSNMAKAKATWGNDTPEWVITLAEACDEKDQGRISSVVGYSAATVSQVLSNSYKGDMKRFRTAVEGALMDFTVNCPVLGELPANYCLTYQRRPFAATNPERVKLYKACRGGCPHSRIGQSGTRGDEP